ncbi:MAG: metallophosphoesterase [Anaerolineae bacterium]
MQGESPVYLMGDVHGYLGKLTRLLRECGLIDEDLCWQGGRASLWFMGDFFDRGPNGTGVVELIMRLQQEAAAVGGQVEALLGNHDILIMAVQQFGYIPIGPRRWTFRQHWERNGGRAEDLARLTTEHMEWLRRRPAMARVGDTLLAHADSTFYLGYGRSIEDINRAFRLVLYDGNMREWDEILDGFATRHAFDNRQPGGSERAADFLSLFGARRLVHGHTPIPHILQCPAELVAWPLIYANGLCVNIDGGMYSGGPGFLYQLEAEPCQS